MKRATCISIVLLLAAWSAAPAQEWARKMFDHTSHDFGVVARGAKAEHRFTVENGYLEDAHISAIRSTCSCASTEVAKRMLKTWEKTELIVTLDTTSFKGRKDMTLTVVFDMPFPAEVQLHVYSFIRGDIVVQPAAVQFGTVAEGAGAEKRVTISYAGRNDWRIADVQSVNPHLEVRMAELSRDWGQVSYDLRASLSKDAPAGYIRDQLILVTNDLDAQRARIPVPVEGVVVPAVTVRPSPLSLGVLKPGDAVTRQLVVQSATPVQVVKIDCADDRFTFGVPEGSKTLHLIPVTFTGGDKAEEVAAKIQVTTDSPSGRALEVTANVRVVAPESDPVLK